MSVLDARSGRLVRTVAVGGLPDALAVAVHSARIFITNGGDGSVSVRNARQGTLLRTIFVGARPGALAVDQRRGRVVVLSSEELVPSAPVGQVQVLKGRTGRLLHTVADSVA